MSEKSEEHRETIAGMDQAVRDAAGAEELTFAFVLALGDGGNATYLRTMRRATAGDLRQAAGTLLGYATKLANIAEKMDDAATRVPSEEKPS